MPHNYQRRRIIRSERANFLLVLLLMLCGGGAAVCGQNAKARPTAATATPTPTVTQTAPTATRRSPQQASVADEGEFTLETTLGADDYVAYGEVRSIGQQLISADVSALLQTAKSFGLLPDEAQTLLAFLNTHQEKLAGARVIFVGSPAHEEAKLPQVLITLEFPTVAEAVAFEPQLRSFLKIASALSNHPTTAKSATDEKSAPPVSAAKDAAAPLPYYLQRKGRAFLMADAAFDLQKFNAKHGITLGEDSQFQAMRTRLGTEPLFIYLATGQIERNINEQRTRMMREAQERQAKEKQESSAHAETTRAEEPTENAGDAPGVAPDVDQTSVAKVDEQETPPPTQESVAADASPQQQQDATQKKNDDAGGQGEHADEAALTTSRSNFEFLFPMLMGGIIGGGSGASWPDAVGSAVAFEGDSVVLRTLVTGAPEKGLSPIGMFSFLRAGPPLAFAAPNLAPADSEMFLSASLDLPAIFESVLKTSDTAARYESSKKSGAEEHRAETEVAALEKKFGFSIRNDLLPVLGNEIGVSLSPGDFFGSSSRSAKKDSAGFVVFISLRDKAAAQALLPRVLAAAGIKGPGEQAAMERVGDAELQNYRDLSLAFIGDTLVIGQKPQDVRRVVDAYDHHETLNSLSKYASAVGWEPAQKLAQVYVSDKIMIDLLEQTKRAVDRADEPTKAFFTRLETTPQPITYALAPDSVGALHEVHLPKTLLTTLVALSVAEKNKAPWAKNEDAAQSKLYSIMYAQTQYHTTNKSYGTLKQLGTTEMLEANADAAEGGYRYEVNADADRFEATAIPRQYGVTGRQSFYLDQTGIMRGADNGGNRATANDKSIKE